MVWDTRTLEIYRVYLGFTAREALRIFLHELRGEYPPEYDDSKMEMDKALDRYKIEQVSGDNVVIRKRIREAEYRDAPDMVSRTSVLDILGRN